MPEVIAGLVSTIIPVYNRPDMLREAVENVLGQTHRPIEIIISDDGSTNGAGAMADRLAAEHPDITRVVHAASNRGAGLAREAGRQLARGEFIQYLDSDDLLVPRKFELQTAALRRHPECGVAYGYTQLVERDGTVLPRPYKKTGDAMPYLFPCLLVERWWSTGCPLFRRLVCDAVGPWTDLKYSQDWEYDARVGALRTRLAHVAEYVCIQRQHGGLRQTGHGAWLQPQDRVRFFSLLLQHARQAGVEAGSPEMERFSQWVFLNARQSGAMGDIQAARALHAIAWETTIARSAKLRITGLIARCVGWGITGRLCETRDRLHERLGRNAQRPVRF
jgi:glycosyltransferase involved in cell wall biosynthesis